MGVVRNSKWMGLVRDRVNHGLGLAYRPKQPKDVVQIPKFIVFLQQ